jgi:predicted RNA-binding protein with PIN domain
VTTPPVGSVRRALELAHALAVAGERARPPVAAPAALRPLLRFRRLPMSALGTVAQVLDTDDEFRARVARSVDRDDVGRVAWLWLERPDGWNDELAQLLDELAIDSPDHDAVSDKALRRQLEGAERARDRALDQAQRADAELDRARREAADATAARDALLAQVDELTRRIGELTAARNAAMGDLERTKSLLARRDAEKRDLATRVDELETAVRTATSAPTTPSQVVDQPDDGEIAELRATIDDLRRRAQGFLAEIDTLRDDVDRRNHRGGRPRARPRRRPVPIPGGLTDDSALAAAHLLARPGAVLLVDGYNVSMAAWPDADIAEQRARLERVLTDLAARNPRLAIELVFDGAEVLPLNRAGSRRAPGVTVRFTPADVEADDALLDLCEGYPHDRPILVASNDHRVRDGARRRGANTLTAEQLLAVARP